MDDSSCCGSDSSSTGVGRGVFALADRDNGWGGGSKRYLSSRDGYWQYVVGHRGVCGGSGLCHRLLPAQHLSCVDRTRVSARNGASVACPADPRVCGRRFRRSIPDFRCSLAPRSEIFFGAPGGASFPKARASSPRTRPASAFLLSSAGRSASSRSYRKVGNSPSTAWDRVKAASSPRSVSSEASTTTRERRWKRRPKSRS